MHRDVKPQNVIIPDAPRSAAGVAKLADFGVAHLAGDEPLTRTGDVVGTLAYMAPEQAAGRRVDDRADLYSLALVLYEALAGTNPVRAGSPAATARRVGTVLPPLKRSRKDLPPAAVAPRSTARCARGRRSAGRSTSWPPSSPTALPEVSDDGGTVARHPLERTEPLPLPRGVARAAAAVLAGGLLAAALDWTGQPVAVALAAVLAVALLPRIGWLATADRRDRPARDRTARRGGRRGRGRAARCRCCSIAAARRGRSPRWRPLLGLATLAGAYPALAGRARGWFTRAALGALGAWWVLLYDVRGEAQLEAV